MTEQDIRQIIESTTKQVIDRIACGQCPHGINAEAAAKKAVEQVFLTLGADISNPDGVIEVQEDFRHLRRRREMDAAIGRKASLTIVTVAIGVIVALIAEKLGIAKPW
jgi:hypothetical protein